MINGEEKLREMYPDLEEDQYQPAGIDLTLGELKKIVEPKRNQFGRATEYYGLFKEEKRLPSLKDAKSIKMRFGDELRETFYLEPKGRYIAITAEKIEIDDASAQLYRPRSSLLRAGVSVHTAVGDPAFNGHLSYLVVNHNEFPFLLEKGVRFVQLIDFQCDGVIKAYDGDYNESD